MNERVFAHQDDPEKKRILKFALALVSMVASIMFWKLFMRGSDFAWTVQQPAYWDAVVEMLLVLWLYAVVILIPFRRPIYRYALLMAIFLILTYLHAFFYAALVAAVYGIEIYLLGYLLNRLICRKNEDISEDPFFCFGMGMAGFICLVAIASIFKLGTPTHLRTIYKIVFALIPLLAAKHILKIVRLAKRSILSEGEPTIGLLPAFSMALILTMVSLAICRANLGMDYDSLWYGLRSELVLAPETGIYDNIVMSSTVYVYSKGFETLTLAFSGLNSHSFIHAINIMLAVMTLFAAYRLGCVLHSKRAGLVFSVLLALLPSVMNLAVTAKSDISTIYLQLTALILAVQAMRQKNGQYFCAAFAMLALTLAFKPSSIVFSTLIALVLIALAIVYKISVRGHNLRVLMLPILAVAFLWARTMHITGYPITSLLVSLFHGIGWTAKYPYTFPATRMTSIGELLTTDLLWRRLARLVPIFLNPGSDMVILETTWWGVLFSVIWIVSVLSILLRPRRTIQKMKQDAGYCFLILLAFLVSAASVGTMLLLESPDGNYYMLMQAVTCCYAGVELSQLPWPSRKDWGIMMTPLIACNFLLCIAISPSWIVGVTPIDLSNRGYYNHELKYDQVTLEYHGLTPIANYLREGPIRRLIVYSNLGEPVFALPAQAEPLSAMAIWTPDAVRSADAMEEYIQHADVDGILLDKRYVCDYTILRDLADEGIVHIEYDTERFVLLSIAGASGESDQETLNLLSTLPLLAG